LRDLLPWSNVNSYRGSFQNSQSQRAAPKDYPSASYTAPRANTVNSLQSAASAHSVTSKPRNPRRILRLKEIEEKKE